MMVKITALLDVGPCYLVVTHRYYKVTFRDEVSQCRLTRLSADRIRIVFEAGIEQSAKILSNVGNLTWITSRDEFIKLQRINKMF
jgi:hypothetical protein